MYQIRGLKEEIYGHGLALIYMMEIGYLSAIGIWQNSLMI